MIFQRNSDNGGLNLLKPPTDIVPFEKVAEELCIPGHLLHLWTKKFPLLSAKDGASARTSFTRQEAALLKGLRHMLINEDKGYAPAQKTLDERGVDYVIALGKESQHHKAGGLTQSLKKPLSLNIGKQTSSSSSKRVTDVKNDTASRSFPVFNGKGRFNESFDSAFRKALADINAETEFEDPAPEPADNNSETQKENSADTPSSSFEEAWRNFMRETGRVDTSSVSDLEDGFDEKDDILYIYDAPPAPAKPVMTVSKPTDFTKEGGRKTNNDVFYDLTTKTASPDAEEILARLSDVLEKKIVNNGNAGNHMRPAEHGLNPDQIERLEHALAKLNIIRSELKGTKGVIDKTLKAFGYSAFITESSPVVELSESADLV